MEKMKRHIRALAAIAGLICAISALSGNALAAPFLVNFQVNYTGAAATGAFQQPDNVPLSFQYQLFVDLDNVSHVGPFTRPSPITPPFPFTEPQYQETSFDTNAVGASPVGSALKALLADIAPTYSLGTQANVISADTDFTSLSGTLIPNETLTIIAENDRNSGSGVVIDPGQIGPIVLDPISTFYELKLTKYNSNDLNGEPEDRALDQNDLLSDFFFVGAEFDISEGITQRTLGLPSPIFGAIDSITYTGTAVVTSLTALSISEPSMLALFGLSLVGLGFARRRKQTT